MSYWTNFCRTWSFFSSSWKKIMQVLWDWYIGRLLVAGISDIMNNWMIRIHWKIFYKCVSTVPAPWCLQNLQFPLKAWVVTPVACQVWMNIPIDQSLLLYLVNILDWSLINVVCIHEFQNLIYWIKFGLGILAVSVTFCSFAKLLFEILFLKISDFFFLLVFNKIEPVRCDQT